MRKLIIGAFAFFFVQPVLSQSSEESTTYSSEGQNFKVEVLVQQESIIWGFDFLPDGRIVFTEKSGALKIFDPGARTISTVKGVPRVNDSGQGGLLDVRVHPEKKNLIYFTYSDPIEGGATTSLGSAQLTDSGLKNFRKLFQAKPANKNTQHFGSRIEFDNFGKVYLSIGDRGKRDQAQQLTSHMGSIVRLNEDGTIPKDNPFVGKKDALPEIWSYGHRNPQGLVFDSSAKNLWSAEMGPRGGDELNLIQKGANYGWPKATFGREYYGPKIGKKTISGMADPVAHWVPSISPSGIAIYLGSRFPKWKGNFFLANLSGRHLRRLVLQDKKVVKQEAILQDKNWRFRHVRAHDGYLYFSTDNGKLARLVPSQKKPK